MPLETQCTQARGERAALLTPNAQSSTSPRSLRLRIASWLALLVLLCAGELSAQDPVYVASSRGQVYYWIGCDAWRSLSQRNLRYFRTAAEAEAAGYRPSQSRGCAPQRDTALIQPRIGGSAPCAVSRIVDGDTFVCDGGSRVRLLLVDSDEIGQSAYADSAVALLRQLMPVGSRVRLEFDVELFDRYDRILAYVYVDSVFVNRMIVRQGMGHVVVYPPNIRMVEAMRAAADTAKQDKLGIWRSSAFECTPAEFRARRCR